MSNFWDGAYSWLAHLVQDPFSNNTHSYVNPKDTEETETEVQEYTTVVVPGEPFRTTKCLFVSEMPNFYTDAQLNTVYHSADEYRNSLIKYGFIYKTQKFDNADTVEKLFDYAKDWIKNNYHGGISNFSIRALDMHLLDSDLQKITTGKRVNIYYYDPDAQQDTSTTLTVISAEYDLYNPDNNSYKIGIPDVTLNKVYGETSKSGGGGGGGGKTSNETDEETNTELDGLGDNQDETERDLTEISWAMIAKIIKNGDDAFLDENLVPAAVKEETGNFIYALTPDILKTLNIKTDYLDVLTGLKSNYIQSTGGIDAENIGANSGSFNQLTVGEDAISKIPITISGRQYTILAVQGEE